MKIYFVRHVEYNNPDNIFPYHLPVEISGSGTAKAHRIGEWLQTQGVRSHTIFSSPIKRAIQTATIIQSHVGGIIIPDDRLIETRTPNLQGTKKPAVNDWKVEEDDSSRESRKSILNRVLEFYQEKLGEEKDCIAVSHGDQLTHLYYHLRNKPFPKYIWDPAVASDTIPRGGVLLVEVKDGETHLQKIDF